VCCSPNVITVVKSRSKGEIRIRHGEIKIH
jgi:hypothetical protein